MLILALDSSVESQLVKSQGIYSKKTVQNALIIFDYYE